MFKDADGPENTFQVILAMDGSARKSFVLFKYRELNWVGDILNVAGMQVLKKFNNVNPLTINNSV